MRDSDLPNLFIIGAPKCGTTSMFHWLSEHPQICTSEPKETYYFADCELNYLKIRPNHRQDELSAYLALFKRVDEFTRVKMEGSTHYLYSEPARNFISGISPKPRIIVQLRNPATRIWSHFNYIKQQAVAPIQISFAEYVNTLLSTGKNSAGIFTDEPWPQHLLENQLSYSNYLQHIRLWLDRLPRDHVRILILEELARHKRRSVQDVADWTEVDPRYYDNFEFETVNVTQSRASNKIRRYLGRYAKYFPKSVSNTAKHIVDKSLRPFRTKTSLADQRALANIEDYFAGPNQRLQSEIDIDLSSWGH